MKQSIVERWTYFALSLLALGYSYRGYWIYSVDEHLYGYRESLDLARGIGYAPFVYRIGIVRSAYFLYQHGVAFRYSYALFDTLGIFVAVLLGYRLLTQQRLYRVSSMLMRAFLSVAYIAITGQILSWQDSYKKYETDPTALFIVLMLWLWSSHHAQSNDRKERPAWLTATLLLTVASLQCLIRTEIVMSVAIGFFLVALFVPKAELALSRRATLVVASLLMVTSAATQLSLSRIFFRDAHYQTGAFLMLRSNFTDVYGVISFLDFMPPFALLAWMLWRQRRDAAQDAAGLALFVASLPFFMLWTLIGRFAEVRIFVPFALGLTPLFCQTLAREFQTASLSGQEPSL